MIDFAADETNRRLDERAKVTELDAEQISARAEVKWLGKGNLSELAKDGRLIRQPEATDRKILKRSRCEIDFCNE
ncbi:hypothetical protein ZHAS_00000399 [Anopheles sinensis]|uniref:Uncharacterized protein n=1 Tax=Anopheles sinensis TaxID=74873 RepID=A0A084VA61_ANOSI|nr:hypothetical protein ZHAS_00000399 [Anopheles sinensis]